MVWHRMVSLPLTCAWYGILSDGIPYAGTVIAWFGIGNSGTDIALVWVGKVWQETLLTGPLLIPSPTLTYPTLGCLPSVLGLLCARVWGCAFGLVPVLGDCWCLACPVRHGNGLSGVRLPVVVVAHGCRVLSVPSWIGDDDTGWLVDR